MRAGDNRTIPRFNKPLKRTMPSKDPKGQRIENFSPEDVAAHAREARRHRRPIWTNPFTRERAALWRKNWKRPADPELS